ncbi:MAG: hypothetical protein IT260_05740 [Saprospiraceae bacterium]|nr:hypothetical protein [Saprospiraceae bacterium]
MLPCFRLLPSGMFLLLLSLSVQAQSDLPRRTALPDAIREVSGIVRLPDGKLWLLNDSHNPSELFHFDPQSGALLETRRLPVPNRDWEDLTTDNNGYLYIGDFGNNYNKRRDLCIFKYHLATGQLDSICFRYPDQQDFPPEDKRNWNYNCEAMIFWNDSLHLFSKNAFKGNFVTKHYVLPAKPGQYTAVFQDSLVLKNRVVTGAALSPDGRTLALTSYIISKKFGFLPHSQATAYFFTDFQGSRFFKGKRSARKLPKFLVARQFESITWLDERHWLVANENKKIHRQALWRIVAKR